MNKRAYGAEYEKRTGIYLESIGYRILSRNFRSMRSEIDIVAMDHDTLVFAEVKARSSRRAGFGSEAVDIRKQKRISWAAAAYLTRYKVPQGTNVRFDVVSIDSDVITVLRNAFPFTV